ARQELPLELLVLADVAGDHLADLSRLEQSAEAEAVDAGVVRDHREVLAAGVAQRIDERLGDTTEPEPTDRQQLTVVDQTVQSLRGCGVELVHGLPASLSEVGIGGLAATLGSINCGRGTAGPPRP